MFRVSCTCALPIALSNVGYISWGSNDLIIDGDGEA